MIKSYKEIINGHHYECSLFPARQGLRIGVKLGKVLFSGDLLSSNSLDSGFDFSGNIDAILDLDKDGSFAVELLSRTVRDGHVITESSFDKIYQGNYKELMEALTFVVKSNFSEFFGSDEDKKKENTLNLTDQEAAPIATA